MMVRPYLSMAACVLCGMAGCKESVPEPQTKTESVVPSHFSFDEIAAAGGFTATYKNGREARRYAILESLGGGGGLWDYDNDGLLDVFCPGGGQFTGADAVRGLPHRLHRAKPDLTWQDFSAEAGCSESVFYTHGCAIGDVDNDGFADLLVTGFGGLQLWRNLGDGTFVAAADESGMKDNSWSSSAGWADFNGDGFLDLYVAHYVNWSFNNDPECRGDGPDGRDVCPPREFQGLDDRIFFSNGDGSFRSVDKEAGLTSGGNGLGVLIADLDHDGDVDVYVANDTTPNFLYQNDGTGMFLETALVSGVAMDDRGQPDGSMGLAMADFDTDGLPDLWVTNFETETFALYRNQGDAQFQHISRDAGVMAIGSLFVGFGTTAQDFDLDGDEDLAVLNGHVVYYPKNNEEPQLPVFLENLGDARFRRVIPDPSSGYFSQKHIGRGLAAGDFDRDGLVDLLAVHTNQPASLLRNTSHAKGKAFQMQLIGRDGNRDAVGARVVLHTTNGDQLRHRYGGGSYLAQSDSLLSWGVPTSEEVVGATVFWPGGGRSEFPAWPSGCVLIVTESGTCFHADFGCSVN